MTIDRKIVMNVEKKNEKKKVDRSIDRRVQNIANI